MRDDGVIKVRVISGQPEESGHKDKEGGVWIVAPLSGAWWR